jgi:hypothetical protein
MPLADPESAVQWRQPRSTPLSQADWQRTAAAHAARVEAWTAGHRERRSRGQAHPVQDFLFTYYSHRPAQLRRWHPGAGVLLAGAADDERAGWRWYRTVGADVELDVAAFVTARGSAIEFVRDLARATAARPAHLGCFGLHEWAMVYRLAPGERRHEDHPLRLSPAETDAVVEANPVRCSHFDAFRFFTPPARSLNLLQPSRSGQVALEQPGCLHATMDLYKWAYKLSPLTPSDLVADCFDLARDVRLLDMAASPYDLAPLGVAPVQIETPAGRAEYVRRQKAFAERGQALRGRLLEVLDL